VIKPWDILGFQVSRQFIASAISNLEPKATWATWWCFSVSYYPNDPFRVARGRWPHPNIQGTFLIRFFPASPKGLSSTPGTLKSSQDNEGEERMLFYWTMDYPKNEVASGNSSSKPKEVGSMWVSAEQMLGVFNQQRRNMFELQHLN